MINVLVNFNSMPFWVAATNNLLPSPNLGTRWRRVVVSCLGFSASGEEGPSTHRKYCIGPVMGHKTVQEEVVKETSCQKSNLPIQSTAAQCGDWYDVWNLHLKIWNIYKSLLSVYYLRFRQEDSYMYFFWTDSYLWSHM